MNPRSGWCISGELCCAGWLQRPFVSADRDPFALVTAASDSNRSPARRRLALPLVLVALLSLAITGFTGPARADESSAPTYERDIKPLFAKRCTVCHRASKRDDPDISGGLALDSYEAVLAGTAREKVVVPGRSAESELVRRLADADEERRMPLQDKPLPQPQQELVRRWIDQGAPRGVPVQTGRGDRRQRRASLPGRVACGRCGRWTSCCRRDVKLAPGTLNAAQGGALSVVAADRAAAGGDGPGVAGRQPAAGGRDLRAGRALGPGRRAARGSARGYSRTGARPGVQSRRPAAGRRRGLAGPVGRGAGLLRPRRHADPRLRRARRRRLLAWRSGPTARSSPRPRSIRPSGSGTLVWGGPTACSAAIPISCIRSPTHRTAARS